MRDLLNVHVWLTVLACCALVGVSVSALRASNVFVQFIDQNHPDLWDKLFSSDWQKTLPGTAASRARRFDRMVLFNWNSVNYPDDPEFRRLLSSARWSSIAWLIIFVTTLLSFGQFD